MVLIKTAQTKSDFGYAKFQTADGKVIQLMDAQCVLDGKLAFNSVVGKLTVGENYKVTERDDITEKLLKAEPFNN